MNLKLSLKHQQTKSHPLNIAPTEVKGRKVKSA